MDASGRLILLMSCWKWTYFGFGSCFGEHVKRLETGHESWLLKFTQLTLKAAFSVCSGVSLRVLLVFFNLICLSLHLKEHKTTSISDDKCTEFAFSNIIKISCDDSVS